MSDQPDAAETADTQAIDRLEQALDRIAALVRDSEAQATADRGQRDSAELRARLDRLVGTLRAALAASRDPVAPVGSH